MRARARQLKAWTGLVSGVFIVLVVVLAGCGSTSSQAANTSPTATAVPPTATSTTASTTASTATTAATGGQNQVTIGTPGGAFGFVPQTLTVKVGTTVSWTNATSAPHTVTSDPGSAQAWDSSRLAPGDVFTFTFTTAGTFAYHCSVHPSMHGTIVVTP
jgi:plastocyanin